MLLLSFIITDLICLFSLLTQMIEQILLINSHYFESRINIHCLKLKFIK